MELIVVDDTFGVAGLQRVVLLRSRRRCVGLAQKGDARRRSQPAKPSSAWHSDSLLPHKLQPCGNGLKPGAGLFAFSSPNVLHLVLDTYTSQ